MIVSFSGNKWHGSMTCFSECYTSHEILIFCVRTIKVTNHSVPSVMHCGYSLAEIYYYI